MNEKRELDEILGISPVESLLKKAYEIKNVSKDYIVRKDNNLVNIHMNDYGGLTFVDTEGYKHSNALSNFAMSQLCTKIGVPASYLDKCIKSGRIDLAQENVNSWLEDYSTDLFLREYKGTIRGVLTPKYSVCDSHDILECLKDTVDLDNYTVKGSYLSEERLHLRLCGTEMLPIDGEDLFPAIFVDSSDVGRSTLVVQFGIYKLVCTNGLVISRASGTLFKQVHRGISVEELHEGLKTALSKIDILAENSVEWVKKTQAKKIEHDTLEEFIASIRNTTKLSEDKAKKVIDLMNTRYSMNKWGLINGITEVAQDFTLERRLELETIAGNLLVA